jgi:hypothetical protein
MNSQDLKTNFSLGKTREKMKLIYLYSIFLLIFLIIVQANLINAQFHEISYNNTVKDTLNTGSTLVVQALKYEPYPVNPGDWFDLWVKVQNIGSESAKNAVFTLIPEYPFESNDNLVRDYNLIYGTISAYQTDQTYDSTQVILKYRIKVADNAPEGLSNVKLKVTSLTSDSGNIYNLPIVIGKTKTNFDVVMQDSTSQGTSFAISNIGENTATALTVSVKTDNNVKVSGSSSSIIGNLANGDFTTVTFQIQPNKNIENVTIEISYTDIAGVRNTIDKTVPVKINSNFGQQTTTKTTNSSSKYIYIVIGAILGILLVFIYKKIRKNK